MVDNLIEFVLVKFKKMRSELITKRKKDERDQSFKTNHDLLKCANSSLAHRAVHSKSALDDHFPTNTKNRPNHQSRPSLIERKNHIEVENLPPNGQTN